jgi:hypothetical protein
MAGDNKTGWWAGLDIEGERLRWKPHGFLGRVGRVIAATARKFRLYRESSGRDAADAGTPFVKRATFIALVRAGAGAARWVGRNPAACSPQTTGMDVPPVSSIISPHTAARRRSNRTAAGKEEKKKTTISRQSPVRNCSACC